MNELESALKRLPEPAPPEGLGARIGTRINQLEQERVDAEVRLSQLARATARRDRLAWAVALVGGAVCLGAEAYRLIVGEAALDLMSLRISGGTRGVVAMLPATPAVAALAVGLLLYFAGLLASLRGARYSSWRVR